MAFILLLLELCILLVSASLAGSMLLVRGGHVITVDGLYRAAAGFALVVVFSMGALGMYQHGSREGIRTTLVRIMPSFALGFTLLNALVALRPDFDVGRAAILMFFAMGAAGILITRLLVFKSAESALMEARLIFVGGGAIARECMALADNRRRFHQLSIIGCTPVAGEQTCVPEAAMLPAGESLLALAQRHDATEIVVTLSNRRSAAYPIRQLLECALGGVKVIDAATFFEREASQIRIDSLQPSFLIYGGGFDQGFVRAISKRIFDLVVSGAISIVALPVMLLTGLCIVLSDGGPVFYRQERVGKDGKVFKVLKFRSMRIDAEHSGTPVWAARDDPRVTPVGRWIRKLRIDELPQMLNVVKGEMSFVGPRPERAYFVDQLIESVAYYDVRHSIKPGITGLAQVRYQYGASVDDAIEKRNSRLALRISIISSMPRLAAYTAPDHDQARGSPSSP
ncbi:MAG: TIGR03013 family XrtA/PEP-CTERM system glycosyltransferase [Pseudomonadota bacterium]